MKNTDSTKKKKDLDCLRNRRTIQEKDRGEEITLLADTYEKDYPIMASQRANLTRCREYASTCD